VCSSKADVTGLTGCEQAVLENFKLKQSILNSQYTSISEALAKTIILIESQHPGYVYSPPDSTYTNGRLIKKPEEKK
jgi:hypothetical protein